MKVVDVNVLLYAVNQRGPHHEEARAWLASALQGRDAVGFTWVVIVGFIRLATHPAVMDRPLDVARAERVVKSWLDARASVVIEPGPDHLAVLTRLAGELGGGNATNDAHLAALAVEHDGAVVTFDRDFGRFEGVRWFTPKAPSDRPT